MSVSILQQPDGYSSGFNPMVFKAESDQTGQPNFRYLIRVKDSAGSVIGDFRLPPHYEFGTVKFDAHRTIENFLSYDISNLLNSSVGFKKGVNTFKEFYITVREEYGTPPSGFSSADSNRIFAVNSALDYFDFVEHPIQDRCFFATGVQNATFLTNAPEEISVREGDSYELAFISGTQFASPDHLRVKTYDVNGTLLKSSTFDNTEKANTTSDQRFLSFLIGPGNLNSWTVTSGSAQPLISSNVEYYEISLESATNTLVSEIKTFRINRECLISGEYTRIFFLNSLGRFDAFNFERPKVESVTVENSTYGRLQGVETETSFTYNTHQQERSSFFNRSKTRIVLNSGFVDTATSEWLKEMVQSPLIYMIKEGKFVPVNMVTDNYEIKTTQREKLFNITFEIELANDTQRQRL